MNATAPITNRKAPEMNTRYRNELFESAGERHAAFLDAALPLKVGSHTDVMSYCVDIPMRYAECFAVLRDGRKVPLADKRSFVAWTGHTPGCSLLFEAHGLRIETRIDPSDQVACDAPGNIASIDIQAIDSESGAKGRRLGVRGRRFIAIDGALFG